MNGPTRRDWLWGTGLTTLGLGVHTGQAEEQAQAPPAPLPLNRFPRMVQEHFVAQVRAAEQAAHKAHAALKTRADAEAYVKEVREKIARCFGPMPERTPLKPRVSGVLKRDGYNVEKVIFESRPGFLVTANLYVPTGRKGRMPGVVGSCGHSTNGKAEKAYQSFSQGLARQGYVVLLFDPIGQGERLQYGHLDAKSRPRPGVGEHLHAGNQQFLLGEFLGTWRAWDGIRALDYLLSRDEVDPKHVGITGNSGGGTMTTWLCGVERRWTMAAPSCFVTTFRRNLENELPADTEQCPPRAIEQHLDHADFLAAMAPRPVIILAKEKDFFDVRGSEEAYDRLKRLYRLLDAEDKVGLFVGPTAHGYTKENREAMYRWFNRATGVSDAKEEPTLTLEKDEDLWCTPKGQVAEEKSRTIFTITRDKVRALAKERKAITLPKAKQTITELLKLPEIGETPEFRILRAIGGRKYPLPQATTYAVETEPNVFALVYRLGQQRQDSRPTRGPERAVLYVSHHSADAELRAEPWLAELVKGETKSAVYACDVRGVGESRPDTCGQGQFLAPYGSDYFYAIHSLMLGRPYVGQKTFDLLRVLTWLRAQGHKEVHLAARGWGALPATFAALLDDTVTQVTLKNALTSYADIAQAEDYDWPLSAFVPDVLARFDLPDCYRLLEGKKLRQLDPWGANAD